MMTYCKRSLLYGLMYWIMVGVVTPYAQDTDGTQPDAAQSVPSSTETASATATEQILYPNPQEEIDRIKETQASLQTDISNAQTAVAEVPDVTDTQPLREELQKHVDLLQQIDLTLNQQIVGLEQISRYRDQIQQINDQMVSMATMPADPESLPSFLELDRLRDELTNERNRSANENAKVEAAKATLDQARRTVTERQTQQSTAQDRLNTLQDESARPLLQSSLRTASLQLRLSQAREQLRTIEHYNAVLGLNLYQLNIKYLEKRYEYLVQYSQFTSANLEEIVQRLEKEEFDINSTLQRLNRDKITVERSLQTAQAKIAQGDNGAEATENLRTQQIKLDAINAQAETATIKLELISKRLSTWQQRFNVFNDNAENEQYIRWKSEAQSEIEDLDRRLRTLTLEISGVQDQLLAITQRIETAGQDGSVPVKIFEDRQAALQQISQTLMDRQNSIAQVRRGKNKLIEEINVLTGQFSFRERIEQLMVYEWQGNAVRSWVISLGLAFCVFFALYIVKWIVLGRLKRFEDKKDSVIGKFFHQAVRKIRPWFFFVIAVSTGVQWLTMPVETREMIQKVIWVVILFQIGVMLSFILRAYVFNFLSKRAKRDSSSTGALTILNFFIQVVVWSIIILSGLSALGFNVSAVIAGLGVGGVAVALAVQKILGDLFASLSIVLDKPFVTGDFVNLDNGFLGNIENIGIKTTRIRSLSGEQIICSNSNLLDTRIRNFKRMHERRVVFSIGVIYQTPLEHVKEIPVMLKEIVTSMKLTRFDRAHFQAYGDFSLNYEVVYYVLSPEYGVYMDIQQEINFQIFEKFQEKGIVFAYPTQTVFVDQEKAFQLSEVQSAPATAPESQLPDDQGGMVSDDPSRETPDL